MTKASNKQAIEQSLFDVTILFLIVTDQILGVKLIFELPKEEEVLLCRM